MVDRTERTIAKYAGLSQQLTVRMGSRWDYQ
jgi:hypothetical protein